MHDKTAVVVQIRWARLVLSSGGHATAVCNQPPRPTQPGHPSVGRRNEYWQWFRPSLRKKQRVLCTSRACYQDCWHIDLRSCAGLIGSNNPRWLKAPQKWASLQRTLAVYAKSCCCTKSINWPFTRDYSSTCAIVERRFWIGSSWSSWRQKSRCWSRFRNRWSGLVSWQSSCPSEWAAVLQEICLSMQQVGGGWFLALLVNCVQEVAENVLIITLMHIRFCFCCLLSSELQKIDESELIVSTFNQYSA